LKKYLINALSAAYKHRYSCCILRAALEFLFLCIKLNIAFKPQLIRIYMAGKLIILAASALFAALQFFIPVQAHMQDTGAELSIKELIVKHALEMDLEPELALSIAKAESNFSHSRKSRNGAVGVFQLMPSTARKMGYNPYHLQDNIKCGIAYYKQMYKKFGTMELALAAYNAGPANVRRYGGIPPFKETRRFISKIMDNYNGLKINPDPAVKTYEDKILPAVMQIAENPEPDDFLDADAHNEAVQNTIKNEIAANNFRMRQEAVIEAYLSEQGV